MQHFDLGDLGGPLLIFGGPYSNAQATAALIARARELGIPPARMICTGDLVAYCAAPARTTALVRALGCPVLAGNCEIQLAEGAEDCGCGFEKGTACDLLSRGWYGHADRMLGRTDRAWMARLPELLTFTHRGRRHALLHGGVSEVARFLWSCSPEAAFEAEWDLLEAQVGPVEVVLAGHSGIPFEKGLRRGRWINAGVIGMPPHDGGRETRFALLDGDELSFERLTYDAEGAAAEMAAAGLAEGYRAGLLSGYWPSEEVLPEALRVPPELR